MRAPKLKLAYIRRVLRFIESGPRQRFDMTRYHASVENYGLSPQEAKKQHFPECGTKACFAGWGVLLQLPKSKWQLPGIDAWEIHDKAKKLFGFTEKEAYLVFENNASSGVRYSTQLNKLKAAINRVLKNRGSRAHV